MKMPKVKVTNAMLATGYEQAKNFGTIPSSWFHWSETWDASFLLAVARRLEANGINRHDATRDQVEAAMRVEGANNVT